LLAIYQTRDQKSEYIGSSNEPLQNQWTNEEVATDLNRTF
jgi:hypothetical protein